MPIYEYKGLNQSGKSVKGILDAESKAALRQVLQGKGVFVTEVYEGKGSASGESRDVDFKRMLQFVGLRDVAVLTRQLATLLKAGIPLVESLTALTEQAEKDELRRALSDIRQKVNEGSALATAMADHPKIFGDLYVNMVRAGESSGNLDVVLMRLTEFLENQLDLRSKVIGAMIYPIVMTFVGMAILGFLFAFVIPKVTKIFKDQDQALPFITRVLLLIADVVSHGWFIIIPLMIAAVLGFRWWKASPKGRPTWDRFVLKVPVFGQIVRLIAVARFSRTLGTLLGGGAGALLGQSIDRGKVICR